MPVKKLLKEKEKAGTRRADGTGTTPGSPVIHSRVGEPLYKWLLTAAEQDGRSVSSYVERLLSKELARQLMEIKRDK